MEICEKQVGPMYFWIMMEALAFYCYMGATVAYILYCQCRSSCYSTLHSDMKKQTEDFLTYEKQNLTWFAFNFVLILLPPGLMYLLNHDDANYQLQKSVDEGVENVNSDQVFIWERIRQSVYSSSDSYHRVGKHYCI